MASLLLLLSEILRHENIESLVSSPPPSSGVAPPSSAAKGAAGEPQKAVSGGCKSYNELQAQQDLPRFCLDLTWP